MSKTWHDHQKENWKLRGEIQRLKYQISRSCVYCAHRGGKNTFFCAHCKDFNNFCKASPEDKKEAQTKKEGEQSGTHIKSIGNYINSDNV